MRTFIAIALSQEVKLELVRIQKELRIGISGGVSWVNPEISHLTLKFLGEVSESALPAITSALKKTCASRNAFDISCGGVGCFPSPRQPRVIWLGVQPSKNLSDLQSQLEDELFKANFAKDDKRFSPHLTIGRVKNGLLPVEVDYLRRVEIKEEGTPQILLPVNSVILFISDLLRSGPVYSKILEVPLIPITGL